MAPLPRPPANEYNNQSLLDTVRNYAYLFETKVLIKVDHFKAMLRRHPNQPLVDSICRALREGFWPWADTHPLSYPESWDNSDRLIKSEPERLFINVQVTKEVGLGRYSQPFRPVFLPGMYSSPLHTVPKEGSTGFRLIKDQSDSIYSPNSMISRDNIAGTCMDGLKQLGASLHDFQRVHGDHMWLVMWKSDIQSAYWNMPIHPLFQLKQIVMVDKRHYVDHCNCFGNQPHTSSGFLLPPSSAGWLSSSGTSRI